LLAGAPDLDIHVSDDRTRIFVVDAKRGYRLVIPYADDWELINPQHGAFHATNALYEVIVASPVVLPRSSEMSAREHLELLLDGTINSRYIEVRRAGLLDLYEQTVLCYQSRMISSEPWEWSYHVIIKIPDGWHHLVVNHSSDTQLDHCDHRLAALLADGFALYEAEVQP